MNPSDFSHPESNNQIRSLLQRKPLFFFFVFAYAISWILSIPFILSEWGVLQGNFQIFFIVKSFGPFLAAYILTGVLEGKDGLQQLRKRIRPHKASWGWVLLLLLGIPAVFILAVILQPGKLTGFSGLPATLLISYPLTFVVVFFGGGPLGEEPGWRGFALPRLQSRYGALLGTGYLAVLWTCWHLPDFLTSAQGGGPGTGWGAFLKNFPLFFLLVLALAILFTWIYNRNQQSIWMVLLAHASVNTPQVALIPLFPAVDTSSLNLAALIGFGLPALLIVLLTRGKLGLSAASA